jgi:hypothetical protein
MIALLAPGTQHPGAQVAALTVALAALAAAVADLREAQLRLHQAEAARAGAERLRTVAPVPGPPPPASTSAEATPPRRRTAADIAALSMGRGPFRVTPADVPAHPRPANDPANLRPGPNQHRVSTAYVGRRSSEVGVAYHPGCANPRDSWPLPGT